MVRLLKHRHQATLFDQEELRLPNGDYHPDAPEKLHQFWLKLGLYIEFEFSEVTDMLKVKHMLCVEDVS